MKENFLLYLLERGECKLTKEGNILILGEFGILWPVRVFLKLNDILREKIKDGEMILYDLGKFQAEAAIKRYKKVLGVQKLSRTKATELFTRITNVIGVGNLEIKVLDYDNTRAVCILKSVPTAKVYSLTRKKAEKPIDHYICGILAGGFKGLVFGKEVKCIETKCIACGDPVCQFEVKLK